jgi:hypothetical protein
LLLLAALFHLAFNTHLHGGERREKGKQNQSDGSNKAAAIESVL